MQVKLFKPFYNAPFTFEKTTIATKSTVTIEKDFVIPSECLFIHLTKLACTTGNVSAASTTSCVMPVNL